MILILSVAGIITLVAAVVLMCGLINAPDGHEDNLGFHADKNSAREGTVWCAGEISQQSHSMKG
jgi:hypothetical protein